MNDIRMKIMIVFLFGLVTVGQVIGEGVQNKDIYVGKREDDHGDNGRYIVAGKGLMPGIQYANNAGHATHYVLAPASQPQHQKYQLAYSSNSHPPQIESVPYPGVHYYPSKLGPIQYAVAPHPQMSYQPPLHMILAAVQPNPPPHHHRGHNGPGQHGSGHHIHMNGGHVTIGVPAPHKYAPASYNAISPAGHQVIHLSAPHHGPRHQQSGFVPISIPVQSLHRQPAVSHAVAVYPTAQVTYAPTATAPQPHHHHEQQHEEQHSTIQAPQVTTTTTVLQPSHHYASAQAEHSQAYQQQQHYSGREHGQNQHYQQQQQPHYSYSIQPSIQVAASKQVAPPSGSTPQFKHESFAQYSSDPNLASSYLSLVREYTMNPGKGSSHVQQVYYPTPSTPVYTTPKSYVMTHVQPTGPGSTVEYSSSGAGSAQFANQYYQQLSGKASAVSASKYA